MIKRAIFVFFLIFILGVSSWARGLTVSTSIFILSTIVKDIGKGRVKVSYVIPASANPHMFSPTPRDLLSFARADLFIGVGYDFEFWFNRIKSLRNGKPDLFLSKFYKNPIGNGRRFNPHIWLDVRFMRNVGIDKITDEMCKLDRKNCSYFRKNADKLKKKIEKIERSYINLGKENNYCIVDIKPAFEYFLRSFNMKSCDVVVKEGSSIPSVSDIKGVFKNCGCNKGVVIYINLRRMADTIAESKGYRVVRLNPLGDPSNNEEDDYVRLIEYDLKKLSEALR